jgi:hypothetical protein
MYGLSQVVFEIFIVGFALFIGGLGVAVPIYAGCFLLSLIRQLVMSPFIDKNIQELQARVSVLEECTEEILNCVDDSDSKDGNIFLKSM